MDLAYSGKLTQSQRQAMLAMITARLQHWMQQWLADKNQTVEILQSDFQSQLFKPIVVDIANDNIWFNSADCICFSNNGQCNELAMQSLLACADNHNDQRLLSFVSQKMIAQLHQSLLLNKDSIKPVDKTEKVFSSCVLHLKLGSTELVILLQPSYVHQFILTQHSSEQTLTPAISIKNIVAQQQVSMKVSIETQALSVSQLMSLESGHIIPLQQLIESPLHIRHHNHSTHFYGFLVKQGGQKAVYITGVNP